MTDDWPKHADGTNKSVAEMTEPERRAVMNAARDRFVEQGEPIKAAMAKVVADAVSEEANGEWLGGCGHVNWEAEATRWKAAFEHECRSNVEGRAKVFAMDQTIYRFRAALMECLEWFEEREDVVDGSDGQTAPNEEMKMTMSIKETLGLRP